MMSKLSSLFYSRLALTCLMFSMLTIASATLSNSSSLMAAEPAAAQNMMAKGKVERAIRTGVKIILQMQEVESEQKPDPKSKEPGREWPYQGVYRERGKIPAGYRVGGTSICSMALLRAPGMAKDKKRKAAIEQACSFVLEALEWKSMSAGFNRGYDVRGWGHAYALGFLLEYKKSGFVPEALAEGVDAKIKWLIDTLQSTEIVETGGWNYSRRAGGKSKAPASTFMTGPTLQFLFMAQKQGYSINKDVVERALATIEVARIEDTGAYQYGSRPKNKTGKGFEAVPGAIGRMPVCESTLFYAGKGDMDRLRKSLNDFFTHWEWLEKRRKQNGTHIPPYYVAPYYFYFAHYYTAQAIELLPKKERKKFRNKLYQKLFQVRESNGSWNDRVFDRSASFGTAMTIMAFMEPEIAHDYSYDLGESPKKEAKPKKEKKQESDDTFRL